MSRLVVLFLLVCFLCLRVSCGYKLLYFSPRFGISHVTFIGSVADKLVEAGHDVTVLISDINPLIKTNGTKLAKVVVVPRLPSGPNFFGSVEFMENIWTKDFSLPLLLKVSGEMREVFTRTCEHVNSHSRILNQLREEKFDLALTEVFDGCSMGLIEVLQIPAHVIVATSIMLEPVASIIGVPIFPSYVPASFSRTTDQMSYTERVLNYVSTEIGKFFFNNIVDAETQLFKRLYGNDFIDLREKIAQSSFVLTNGEPLLDFPHPTTQKVIEIGGLSIPNPQPLDKFWENAISTREKVIIMSFGSVARSEFMPLPMKKMVLNTFARFPDITFLWKYEAKDLPLKDHPNVITTDWLPQNDLLNQPKVVAFVTHGGMNSVIETATRGKPMVTIPLFAEQVRNANMVKRAGIGVPLEKHDLLKEGALYNAIKTVITGRNYSRNAKFLSRMLAKKPVPANTLLIKHIEFAAEFGRLPSMDPMGRTMPFYSYYMLDFFVPLACIALLLLTFAAFFTYKVASRFIKVKKIKIQ